MYPPPPINNTDIGRKITLFVDGTAISGSIADVTNDSKRITININNQLVQYTTDVAIYPEIPKLPSSYYFSVGKGKRKSRRRIRRHSRRSKRTHKKTRRYIRR